MVNIYYNYFNNDNKFSMLHLLKSLLHCYNCHNKLPNELTKSKELDNISIENYKCEKNN